MQADIPSTRVLYIIFVSSTNSDIIASLFSFFIKPGTYCSKAHRVYVIVHVIAGVKPSNIVY